MFGRFRLSLGRTWQKVLRGVRPSRPAQRYVVALAIGAALPVMLAAACGDTDRRVPSVSVFGGAGGPGVPDPCATPSEGCSCEQEGIEVDCGQLTERFDDYVTCQMGTRTCENGQWGACAGDRVTVKSTTPDGDLQPQALGMPEVCGNPGNDVDPCDPYCNLTPDTPGGFDAGPGFSNTDAGLTLTGVADAGVACTTLTLTPSTTTATVTSLSAVTTTPAAPVTFTLAPGPVGCVFTPPFATTWVIDKVERATITGTNNTNGTLALNVPIAGPVVVTAYALGMSATATITFKVNVVEAPITDALASPNDSAATSSPYTAINAFTTVANACAPTVLDGCRNSPNVPVTASTATWLYPQADTYFPLGLQAPWVQYLYASSTTPGAVKVSLRYPTGLTATAAGTLFNYSLIVEEMNGAARAYAGISASNLDPQVVLPQTAWQYFEQTARGQNADILIQRRRGNGTLETELRRTIRLVDGQLKGTVFYSSYNSALAGNTGAVLRISPGASTPTVAVQPTSTSTAGGTRRCTVCHTVNDSGTRLIVNGQRPTGSITFNQSRRYDVSNAATPAYAVPVINDYNNSNGSDGPDYNISGDRFTYGAPFLDGTLYMTHGGKPDSGYQGDRNWRAPDDYSRLYRLLTTPVAGSNVTALTVTNWTDISAVTPHFSHDGTKLAFGFWGSSTATLPCSSSAVSPCTGNPRRLSPVAAGTRLVVADFSCASPPCTATSTNFSVTNARDVTNGVTHRVAWPAFTPTGNGVFYQRQYRTSMSSGNGGVIATGWSPSHLNTVTGALAEIWLSNIPANGSTLAVPTQLRALNGLNAAGTATLLPTASRLAAPAQNTYHAANASFTINIPDNCSASGTATGVNDYQLNYLPSVAPTQAGGFTWVVFTSRRMFGNIAYQDPWDAAPGQSCNSGVPPSKKLWVAAVDATWTPGTDPSHPAFYLPGQELAAANADADWVSSPCGGLNTACSSHDDCCLATGAGATRECRITSTAPLTRSCQTISDCSAIGEACTVAADCCTGTCPTNGGICFVPPPPVIPTYAESTTTREYTATCPEATHVKWRLFEWQATVPAGTSIDFRVQTKQNAADPYLPAVAAQMSSATPASGTGPGTWYRGASTADQVLAALPSPLPSSRYLRVSMVFKPNSGAAPILHQWRQIYDCMPNE
jgi:hypothetical protein